MTDLLVTAELPNVNGRPSDTIVNTFAFHSNDDLDDNLCDLVASGVQRFYTQPGEGGAAGTQIGNYLQSQITRVAGGCFTKVYDITGRLGINPATGRMWNHGSPQFVETFTMPAAASQDNLPSQMAVVLTLRARDYGEVPVEIPGGPGDPAPVVRPRARRSGRVFIGPFQRTYNDGISKDARPSLALRQAIAASAESLQQWVNTDGAGVPAKHATWCVWSRTAANMHAIVEASVDDSWDVIRSRKTVTTGRTSRVFAPVPDLALGA